MAARHPGFPGARDVRSVISQQSAHAARPRRTRDSSLSKHTRLHHPLRTLPRARHPGPATPVPCQCCTVGGAGARVLCRAVSGPPSASPLRRPNPSPVSQSAPPPQPRALSPPALCTHQVLPRSRIQVEQSPRADRVPAVTGRAAEGKGNRGCGCRGEQRGHRAPAGGGTWGRHCRTARVMPYGPCGTSRPRAIGPDTRRRIWYPSEGPGVRRGIP